MKNSEYWRGRSEILELATNKSASELLTDVEKQFNLAQKQLGEQIEQWYGRFAVNNNISLAEAKQRLTGKDLAEFKWDVNEYIKYGRENAVNQQWMKQLENASARFHISKLEALKLKTQNIVENLYGKTAEQTTGILGKIYRDNYYHTAFDLQQGFNVGWDVATISKQQLNSVMAKPWTLDGRTFSDNLWTKKEQLVGEVHNQITQNVLLGRPPDKAISVIAKKMGAAKSNAGRIVMTESAYFASKAQKDAYSTLDVEEFEVVGTLDAKTCGTCGAFDGTHTPMKDYEAGVTAPPFHPWCRCCTAPYFDDDVGERFARGEDGKGQYVPSDMGYEEWKASYVDKTQTPRTISNINLKNDLTDVNNGGIINTSLDVSTIANNIDYSTGDDNKARKQRMKKLLYNTVGNNNIKVTAQKNQGAWGEVASRVKARYNQQSGMYDSFAEVDSLNLSSNDSRHVDYKRKTEYHELFHANANGLQTDRDLFNGTSWVSLDGYSDIEEVFAECSANYLVKATGAANRHFIPSYPKELVETIPKLKEMAEFSGVTKLDDLGEIVADFRFGNNKSAEWGKYAQHIKASTVNVEKFIESYADDIVKHSKDYWTELILQLGGDLKDPKLVDLVKDASAKTGQIAEKMKKTGFSSLTLKEIEENDIYDVIAYIMTKMIK